MDIPRILLVDDDPAVRAALKFTLELEGFEVETFEDGETLASLPSLPKTACLVLDYRLPGMNGLALLALLRAKGSTLPAIIITSNPTRTLHRGAAASNAIVVEKPLLCDALSSNIRALMRWPSQAGTPEHRDDIERSQSA